MCVCVIPSVHIQIPKVADDCDAALVESTGDSQSADASKATVGATCSLQECACHSQPDLRIRSLETLSTTWDAAVAAAAAVVAVAAAVVAVAAVVAAIVVAVAVVAIVVAVVVVVVAVAIVATVAVAVAVAAGTEETPRIACPIASDTPSLHFGDTCGERDILLDDVAEDEKRQAEVTTLM